MKKISLLFTALVIALAGQLIFADTTLYSNVNGYTLNSNRELVKFSAVQFTDDKIDRLHLSDEELPSEVDVTVDGKGQTLIPGLIDAHGEFREVLFYREDIETNLERKYTPGM